MILDIAIQLLIQDQKYFKIKYITAIPIALLYSASEGFRVLDDSIFHSPGVCLPVRLFTNLKEIEFLEEKFNVPKVINFG